MKNPVGIQARNTKNQQDTVLRFALGAGGRWFKSIRPDSCEQFGKRLRQIRNQRGWSQEKLARANTTNSIDFGEV